VKLHKLRILERNAGSEGHRVSITGAGVGTGAREVSTTVATSCQHSVVGSVACNGKRSEEEKDRVGEERLERDKVKEENKKHSCKISSKTKWLPD